MINSVIKILICILAQVYMLQAQKLARVITPDTNAGKRYALKTYTTHDGLPADGTTAILKDKRGFIWVGTENGLCRFDGYTFKNLTHVPGDSTSLTSNYVSAIAEDKDGNIWVGTMDGLNVLNTATEKFKRFYHKDGDNPSLSNNKVWSVLCDRQGEIWIGTDNGFDHFLARKNAFEVYKPDAQKANAMVGKSVNAIVEDAQGYLWLGNWSGGLNRFDKTTHQFINYPQQRQPQQKNPNDVWSLYYDAKDEKIWVGTYWKGLFEFDLHSHQYISSRHSNVNNASVFSIDEADKDQLIVEGDAGFFFVNKQTNRWTKIDGLSSSADGFVYNDKDGILWLCGKEGLSRADFKQYKFNFMPLNVQPREVKSLLMDGAAMWLATNKGLFKYDFESGASHLFVHTRDPNSIASNQISKLYKDHEGTLWIATENGFDKYDQQSGRFIHHYHHSALGNLFNEDVFRDILEVKPHEYWLATDAGLKIYNEQTHTFTHYYNDDRDHYSLNNNHLYCLLKDDKGDIWIGTNGGGINKFDSKTKHFSHYQFGDRTSGNLSNNIVHYIYQDSHKNIWVCTPDGLNKFIKSKNSFVTYSIQNGFASNVFNDVVEDGKGNLWVTTAAGISMFNPQTLAIKNFDAGDGVFSHTILYRSTSDDVYVAGNLGIVNFRPKDIQLNQEVPKVYFSDFEVFNKAITPGPHSPLKTIIDRTEKIELNYDQSVFSIEFGALNYTHSEKNQYAYILEGFDKKWINADKQRKATYTNLNPGTYVFKVIASNNDGVWNRSGRSLIIVIVPPWYQTWWAYLVYAGLFAGVVYTYLLYRDRQARLKYKIKIAHIESEKEKELSERKLSFFTNISHEFRTPLTLIINPVKELLNKGGAETDQGNLNIVYRNARRLLSLVDQLLLFRKADLKGDKLHVSKLNIVELCKEVYLCFVHQARNKNIKLELVAGNEQIDVFVDREKIEIALFNLLSNAFKFTPENGIIQIVLGETIREVSIQVIDSGCGISEKAGSQLYQCFYQESGNSKSLQGGFGIGLYLVKTFVERHGGTIDYQSCINEGTTFSICLLKGYQHLSAEEIFEDTATVSAFFKELTEEETIPDMDLKTDGVSDMKFPFSAEEKTLLIIEDNIEVRTYLKQIFKAEYRLLEAADGSTGLDLIKEHNPNMVICDVMMQGMSGIELCSVAKSDPHIAHIPIILLTASAAPEIKLKGIEGGADDYISKPFDKDELLARVRGLIKSRTILHQYFYDEITLNKNPHKVSIEYKSFLENCIHVVEQHLDDSDFSTQVLAEELGISYSSLCKKIRMISGQSANAFIRFIRLRKAAELFVNTNINIMEVSYQIGIRDIKYFREQFKKLFHMNPSQYVKRYRKTFNSEVINLNRLEKVHK